MAPRRKAGRIEPLLGAHMSIAGGTPLAIERAGAAGCNVLQIFVKNNMRWKGKPLPEEEVKTFGRLWSKSEIHTIVAHDTYLINFAALDEGLWRRSIAAFQDEMERCERLGLSYLVTHPGSHVGGGVQGGIRHIARALDEIYDRTCGYQVRIALETTAGQGTSIGYRFEHLRDIFAGCRHPERVFVCMDTCHVFAAGYDIRERDDYLETVEKFDQTVGIDKLQIFHFNDSKKALGSRVDRHEHIGKGEIGVAGFTWILKDPRFVKVPKILETPKGRDLRADRRNLRVLRSLLV